MFPRVLFVAALTCFVSSAHAQENAIMLAMTLDQNGKQLSAPQILVRSADPAEIKVGDQLQLKVVATDSSGSTDVQFKVYADEGSGLALVGSPRILVAYGQSASLIWSSGSGTKYKLTITPTLTSTPSHS
jgi:hypothetical protein